MSHVKTICIHILERWRNNGCKTIKLRDSELFLMWYFSLILLSNRSICSNVYVYNIESEVDPKWKWSNWIEMRNMRKSKSLFLKNSIAWKVESIVQSSNYHFKQQFVSILNGRDGDRKDISLLLFGQMKNILFHHIWCHRYVPLIWSMSMRIFSPKTSKRVWFIEQYDRFFCSIQMVTEAVPGTIACSNINSVKQETKKRRKHPSKQNWLHFQMENRVISCWFFWHWCFVTLSL